jgi:hypothetical protein
LDVVPASRTVTEAVPTATTSAADICALRFPFDWKVVGLGEPFHCTTDVPVNSDPYTFRVNAADPTVTSSGDSDEIDGTAAETV